jgi:hypothetical protein
VGFAAFCGFLFGGLTGLYFPSIIVTGVVLFFALTVLHKIATGRRVSA